MWIGRTSSRRWPRRARKTGWQVHAYCLMRNHYHLVLETPNANLVAGMAWLQSSYTIRLNHRHQLFGHVFSGRYKAQLVEGSGNGYLRTACDYVHLNPVRARTAPKPRSRLLAYPWSSLMWYLAVPEHRPAWIRVDRLLGEHGIQRDKARGRQEFERRMEARRLEAADDAALKALRRGWLFGQRGFPRGNAKADGGQAWREPLRGIAARDGPRQSREDCGRGVEAVGLEGAGFLSSAQGRPCQAGHSGAVEARDDAVDPGDRGAGGTRHFQKCERTVAPVAAGTRRDEGKDVK